MNDNIFRLPFAVIVIAALFSAYGCTEKDGGKTEGNEWVEIHNYRELQAFADRVNNDHSGLVSNNRSVNARLMADIDMSVCENWCGIGNELGYEGIFDGNGKVIRNLRMRAENNPDDENPRDACGFINFLSGSRYGGSGTVRNLGIENCDIEGSGEYISGNGGNNIDVGGIAGLTSSGTLIENCYVTGKISNTNQGGGSLGSNTAGGICGVAMGTVRCCYTDCEVISQNNDWSVGGIGGICGSVSYGKVVSCYALGDVAPFIAKYSGALIGSAGGHGSVVAYCASVSTAGNGVETAVYTEITEAVAGCTDIRDVVVTRAAKGGYAEDTSGWSLQNVPEQVSPNGGRVNAPRLKWQE